VGFVFFSRSQKRPRGFFSASDSAAGIDDAFFFVGFFEDLLVVVATMRKGEQTRQRILREAAALFNQRGYAGCSMQDVMAATGLEKGGLYRHFSSKEELAGEAFRYALGQANRMRMDELDGVRGSVERLRCVVRQFAEAPSGTPGGCPLMNTAVDADDGNPVLRRLALEGIAAWKAKLERIVREGKRRGEIRGEVEPRRIANTMIATLEGALMISRLEGNQRALEDARTSLEALLDGIAVA
jgi:TetR/AcrR family transcriptional repressor of nem operon